MVGGGERNYYLVNTRSSFFRDCVYCGYNNKRGIDRERHEEEWSIYPMDDNHRTVREHLFHARNKYKGEQDINSRTIEAVCNMRSEEANDKI